MTAPCCLYEFIMRIWVPRVGSDWLSRSRRHSGRGRYETGPFRASGFPTDFTNQLLGGVPVLAARRRSTPSCPNTTVPGNSVPPREPTLCRRRRNCLTR